MNRAISGTVAARETGRPLEGLYLVPVRLTAEGPVVLGITRSGPEGRFRVEYPRLSGPADLTVFLFTPVGVPVYREPVHRGIEGAELQIRIAVPNRLLGRHQRALG